jgi:hypothetical protein
VKGRGAVATDDREVHHTNSNTEQHITILIYSTHYFILPRWTILGYCGIFLLPAGSKRFLQVSFATCRRVLQEGPAGGSCGHGSCRKATGICRKATGTCRKATSTCRKATGTCRKATGNCRRVLQEGPAEGSCRKGTGNCRKGTGNCRKGTGNCRKGTGNCRRVLQERKWFLQGR